ncbi:MAG: transglutaminase domain-containing protein [Bacteroidota bacterium]
MSLRLFLLLVGGLYLSSLCLAQEGRTTSHEAVMSRGCSANNKADLLALVACLLEETTTPEEQLWQLAFWIADNIAYDVDRQIGAPKSCDDSTLKYRRGHCSDYATLFKDMCTLANLDCYLVEGYAKKWGGRSEQQFEQPDHVWNAVVLADTILLFDLTWAAGVVSEGKTFEKAFNPAMINADPATFLSTHLPAVPQWQLQTTPVPIERFEHFSTTSSLTEGLTEQYNYRDSIIKFRALDQYDQAIKAGQSAYQFHPTHANFRRWLTNTLHQCNLIWEDTPTKEDYQRTIRICERVHQLATSQPDFPQQKHFQERALLGVKYARYMLKSR